MSRYMLMLHAEDPDEAEDARRTADLPLFIELHESLREAGLLVRVQALRPPDTATTLRIRDGETEITDGPHATTKEGLVGFYILECEDLDEALEQAARIPLARYGTIEVRPAIPAEEWLDNARAAGADVTDAAVEDFA